MNCSLKLSQTLPGAAVGCSDCDVETQSVRSRGNILPLVPAGSPSRGGDVTVYVFDIN